MANVIQAATAPVHYRPFIKGTVSRSPGSPVGILTHTENNLAIDAIGVGDTAGLRLELTLPQNFAYMLHRGLCTVRGTGGMPIRWTNPVLIQYFSGVQGVDPAATTEIDCAMSITRVLDTDQDESHLFAMGGGALAYPRNAGGHDFPPSLLVYGMSAMQGAYQMSNPTASTDAVTMSYIFQWLVWDVEESLSAAMFSYAPIRS